MNENNNDGNIAIKHWNMTNTLYIIIYVSDIPLSHQHQ